MNLQELLNVYQSFAYQECFPPQLSYIMLMLSRLSTDITKIKRKKETIGVAGKIFFHY